MECEEWINLICADIDSEISPDDRRCLEGHLAQCADCRATAEAMRLQDAQLVRAFAPGRKTAVEVAGRVVSHPPRRSRLRWLVPLASAAAGFLLALSLLPIRTDIAPSSAVPVIGHLDIATGPVEIRSADGKWQRMLTGAVVSRASRVRTGPGVRCEFAMDDGSQVRLNENSELQINDSRKVNLANGQIFSVVAKQSSPFELSVAGVTVSALGTKFDVQCEPDHVVLAVVDGQTRLDGQGTQQIVNQGQVVDFANGRVTRVEGAQALDQATRWITDILVLKGRDDPELSARIDDLFAQIGEDKMAFLRENELKSLGDRCVVPLTRYLQSSRSNGKTFKRQEAARILSDVAQPWCIPDLITLLLDHDGDVRASAALALLRLTNQTQGRSIDQWRKEPAQSGKAAFQAWQEWWQHNQDHYPGAQSTKRAATAPA